jgi:uncharacterized protein YjbI with pentapeptide repeats
MTKKRFPIPAEPRIDESNMPDIDDDEDEIESARYANAVFTSREFDGMRATDVAFEDCELSAASMHDASFVRVAFRQCRMSGVSMAGTKFRDVTFIACKLDQANLRGCDFERCLFLDCDLRDASFNESSFVATQLNDCNLERGEFSFVKIDGLSLRGSQLHDLRGVGHLRNAVIGSDQVMSLAALLITHTGIEVDDDV